MAKKKTAKGRHGFWKAAGQDRYTIRKGPYLGIVSRYRGGWTGEWGLASSPVGSLKSSSTAFEFRALAKGHVERQLAKLFARKKKVKRPSKKKAAKKRTTRGASGKSGQANINAALRLLDKP